MPIMSLSPRDLSCLLPKLHLSAWCWSDAIKSLIGYSSFCKDCRDRVANLLAFRWNWELGSGMSAPFSELLGAVREEAMLASLLQALRCLRIPLHKASMLFSIWTMLLQVAGWMERPSCCAAFWICNGWVGLLRALTWRHVMSWCRWI